MAERMFLFSNNQTLTMRLCSEKVICVFSFDPFLRVTDIPSDIFALKLAQMNMH